MIPRLPYLQNAVSGYNALKYSDHGEYIQWMRDQGVIMPIKMEGDIDSVRIEFTDMKSELMFILRWS